MSNKVKPNGAVVIYTSEGTKILETEVRNYYNVHGSRYKFKFEEPEKYLLIGGARTLPTDNIHAARCRPEAILQALNFTQTKFFRLMIDLQRLAQFEPINKNNVCFEAEFFNSDNCKSDVDFSTSVKDLDAQFYKKYGFNSAMIDFIERHYSNDDLLLNFK